MQARWILRLDSLVKASQKLTDSAGIDSLSELEEEGLIKRFEYTFELSWKTLKDFLALQGLIVQFPRDVIKEAYRYGLIKEGGLWLEMLDDRNLTAHVYDRGTVNEIVLSIKTVYAQAVKELVFRLLSEKSRDV